MAVIKDLGAVTAYASAVEGGYTGTKAEFETLMASYATVAEEAAESAESASQSATQAGASAQTATTKASEATTAAQTATAKAEEAQADADAAALDASQALSAASTATTKASEAAQSASDAVTAKTAAQTAQTAAEGSATTAQTAAQTATQKAAEAAESARTLTIDSTLTQSGQAADAKKTGDEISELKEFEDALKIEETVVDLSSSWTQGSVNSVTGGTAVSATVCRRNCGLITADTQTLLFAGSTRGYNIRLFFYSSSSYSTGSYDSSMTTEWINGANVGYRYNIPSSCIGYYMKVCVSWGGDEITPSDVTNVKIIKTVYTDVTFSQSGKVADAKAVGDVLAKVGDVTIKSFTLSGSTAIANFYYPLEANEQILFMWESPSQNSLVELNLYTRDTSSGNNKEVLATTCKINTWYSATPAQSASYLRVVASESGKITVVRANTIFGMIQSLDKRDTTIEQTRISEEMARFEFSKEFDDISSEALDFGLTNATRNQMADKVYEAFHELSETYSGYVTEVLDAESEIDESLGITLTKPWYMSNVTAGEQHTIPIDGDGGTYTYAVANDSSAYTVRMYKLIQDVPALGNSGGKRKVFITSGVHGNEVMSPINLYLFAEKLCNPNGDADLLKLRGLYDFYILPYVNVFGGRQVTRVNGNLTDINRNFPTDGWTRSAVTPETAATYFANLATCIFSGATKGSEYETQLQMALIDTIHPNITIDHHNSGTGSSGNRNQFYTNVVNPRLRTVVYRAALDCLAAFTYNLPEYFGTNYFTILGTGGSPYTLGSSNGQRGYWMRYNRGYKNTATIEVFESINSYGGAEASTKTPYTGDAFNVAFFTFKNTLLHFCEYDMTHPYEFPDVTH